MRPSADATLADWLVYQERLHPKEIELGLDRVREVAARLALPQAGIPTLTIAGTNGKGSSATLAASIYRQAGYRVGLYTSPHLLHYNERIAIDGVAASDASICAAFAAIEMARENTPLTYFEYGTLAALWLFRESGVGVQVLEVGLGGRLDAVNLVDTDVALITSIGLDHMDWLGNDRERIGREKAGIFRAGRAAICADPQPPASIAAYAAELGAPLQNIDRDFHIQRDGDGWHWHSDARRLERLPLPGLPGDAQLRNASGVLAAIEALQSRLPVDQPAIRQALSRLKLPGRFQRHGRWILDVAHNAEAAEVLAENLRDAGITGKIRLVLGMLADKPVEAVGAALAPWVEQAWFVSLPPPRGLDAETLAQRSRAGGLAGIACVDIADAMRAARAVTMVDDVVVVTGSFLTVATAQELMDG